MHEGHVLGGQPDRADEAAVLGVRAGRAHSARRLRVRGVLLEPLDTAHPPDQPLKLAPGGVPGDVDPRVLIRPGWPPA